MVSTLEGSANVPKSTARKHPPTRGSVEERFWRYVEKTDGCWNWTGYLNPHGYGRLNIRKGVDKLAHRVSLAIHRGLELDGWQYGDLVVDHMCRNRACVNPDHLRLVTQRVNATENAVGPAARNIVKTHCPKGHAYDESNTIRVLSRGIPSRQCRTCVSATNKAWKRAHSARAVA